MLSSDRITDKLNCQTFKQISSSVYANWQSPETRDLNKSREILIGMTKNIPFLTKWSTCAKARRLSDSAVKWIIRIWTVKNSFNQQFWLKFYRNCSEFSLQSQHLFWDILYLSGQRDEIWPYHMTLKTGSRELKVMPLYLNLLEINLVTALKYQYGFKGAFFCQLRLS